MAEPVLAFDLQGHRGARGLLPENTLAGFALAASIGVTTLETDLAVTSDDIVVLSHDPMLNPDLTRDEHGTWLAARGPAIRSLTLAELRRFDVGRINPTSNYARQFPDQAPVDGARIPTLDELFAATGAATTVGGNALRYSIEIKTSPERPDETPDPQSFARRVVEVVRRAGLQSRTTIQAFDWRALLAAKTIAPEIETSCLTIESAGRNNIQAAAGKPSPWLGGLALETHGGSVPRLVAAAGCGTWSPYWRNLDHALVGVAKGLGLKVVPWTLNAPQDMAEVIAMGVDGLISDDPERARKLLAEQGIAVR